MALEVASTIDIYTTVLGWTLYDRIWQALTDTGIALLPFFGVFVRSFTKNWGDAGDEGATPSVRNIELELAGMLTVLAMVCAPVLDIQIGDLSHTQACGNQTVSGGNTGTGYDTAFTGIGGGVAPTVPVWWRAVMAVSGGLSNVAIAATPCKTNLSQLNYQMENTRIADPELRQQIQLFGSDCFMTARAKFARDHMTLPSNYSPDDIDWPGSQYFQDTAGFYDDPNPNLAPRAKEEIPGFPYDPNRDFEYGGTAPASGLGKPTCGQWWTDGNVGLRKRLLEQINPDTLSKFETWFMANYNSKTMADAENEEIRRLLNQNEQVSAGISPSSRLTSLSDGSGVNGVVGGFTFIGNFFHAVVQRAEFYALQQAAPIGQSLILMVIYMSLPFILVFSGYSIESVLMASVGIFAIRFLTALWALASWLDNALTEGLGIEWWKAIGVDNSTNVAVLARLSHKNFTCKSIDSKAAGESTNVSMAAWKFFGIVFRISSMARPRNSPMTWAWLPAFVLTPSSPKVTSRIQLLDSTPQCPRTACASSPASGPALAVSGTVLLT